MPEKKAEVRVFMEGLYLMILDDLIGVLGNTRSEVVRSIVQQWVIEHPERVGYQKDLLGLKEAAQKRGYLTG
jgi:metal-responsive CopG/Arc/MetJ family transcriptional regulator